MLLAILGAVLGAALNLLILIEGFEVMVLPRRVSRRYRLTLWLYRGGWALWRIGAARLPAGKMRNVFLSYFGPLSLLTLFAVWVFGLILGFALLHWSLGTHLQVLTGEKVGFGTYLYLSGVTFFTLGYGEVTPTTGLGRVLAVGEAGLGFGFLAVIIGYLPVLYQAFSRREVTISLLDARAGSPPSAAQALARIGQAQEVSALDPFLAEWERWSAELLESHLSFPVLSFYRSQHDNQSWLAALTAILDTCALLISGLKSACPYHAQLTFAMARHTAVDLALVFRSQPLPPDPDRLPAERLLRLRELLAGAGLELRDAGTFETKLAELRGMYEPFVNAIGQYLLLPLPAVLSDKATVDNWQTSAWMRRVAGIGRLPLLDREEHFN
jgi:Ion channel